MKKSFSPKVRRICSKTGSALLMFQRAPLVQTVLPEARLLTSPGVVEIVKLSALTVLGLGAYDTVTGATAVLDQISPLPVQSTVPAEVGENLVILLQQNGSEGKPGSWEVRGRLPDGLVSEVNTQDRNIFEIKGVPSDPADAGEAFRITVVAWEFIGNAGAKVEIPLTIRFAEGPIVPVTITEQPSSISVFLGGSTQLGVAVNGTRPFNYEWFQGQSGDTSNPISGADEGVFQTPRLLENTDFWVRVRNDGATVDSDTATVSVPSPFNDWQVAVFEDQDEAVAGTGADPDSDGRTNEEEFLFGTDPLVADQPTEPVVEVTGDRIAVNYFAESTETSGNGYDGLTRLVTIETKRDLADLEWEAMTGFEEVVASDSMISVDEPAEGRGFYRVRVSVRRD